MCWRFPDHAASILDPGESDSLCRKESQSILSFSGTHFLFLSPFPFFPFFFCSLLFWRKEEEWRTKEVKRPLEHLRMFLVQKYTEYRAAQAEHAKKKVTEKELSHLNHKIDKLLSKLEEHEPEIATNQDEECVVCFTAKANMTTYPCAHCVVCRRCFVKTIQMAVAQRFLPLRCMICRTKILRLKQGNPANVPQSASLYSVNSNASTSSGVSCNSATSAKTDPHPFPTFRSVQLGRLGYEKLRSSSPPPQPAPPNPSYKRKSYTVDFQPPKSKPPPPPLKGKAKLSQEFQREFRMAMVRTTSANSNSTTNGNGRVRCCGDLVAEEAWRGNNSKGGSLVGGRGGGSLQGRRC